jgi:hypothetical protein
MNNFWDYGYSAYVIFTPSTDNPDGQIVEFPEQLVNGETAVGTGTYDQCLGVFKIQTNYEGSDFRYEFKKQ